MATAKRTAASRNTAPPFVAPGAGTPDSLAGVDVALLPSGKAVKRAADALGNGNIEVHAVAYKGAVADIKAAIADSAEFSRFGYDCLLHSFDYGYYTDATMTLATRKDVFGIVWDAVAAGSTFSPPLDKSGQPIGGTPVQDKKAAEANTRLLVRSMLRDGRLTLYKAHFDNADDTSCDGVVGIDLKNGQVRILSVFTPP
jgi:hypothetical protein